STASKAIRMKIHDAGSGLPPIPELCCPFPAAIHPDAARFDMNSAHFLAKFRLGHDQRQQERLIRGLCEFAGRVVPSGDAPLVQLIGDMAVGLFAFDALGDEGPLGGRAAEVATAVGRFASALDAPPIPDDTDGYRAALNDIRRRLSRLAPSAAV